MAKIKTRKKRARGGSFFLSVVDAFTAFIYSLFANGRTGTWLSSDENEKAGIFTSLSDRVTALLKRNAVSKRVDEVMQNSFFFKFPGAMRAFLAQLSLNVYGMFAVIYGATAVVTYFIGLLVNGYKADGIYSLITAVAIVICSFPLLVSTRSISSAVAESGIMRRISLSFLLMPEEKLKPTKRRGGVVYMFFAVGLGLVCGAATYLLHPAYILIPIACVVLTCIISANPESGVIITVASAPFLQYTDHSELVLSVLIAFTLISYIFKVLRHRRVFALSVECILVLIFCGFILTAGMFSHGGFAAFVESVFMVAIIAGGFFTAYCLTRESRSLATAVSIMAVAFCVLSLIGNFNVLYDGIADGVVYSIREYVQPIIDGNNIHIEDSSAVFSVLAVLSVPLILSFMTRRSSARKTVLLSALLFTVIGACFIYGSYETVITILVEFCIFWLLYSHKTLNVIIVALIPLSILAVSLPYILKYVDVNAIYDSVVGYMPPVSSDSAYLLEVASSTVEMLKDNILGIGVGSEAFAAALAPYTNAVSVGATDPISFWLQLLCWSGLLGAVVFLLCVGLVLKNSLGLLALSEDNETRSNVLALVCGVIGALLIGSVNCIWNDPRMLYLFWVCVGFLASYVRKGRELEKKQDSELASSEDNTDVALRFYK